MENKKKKQFSVPEAEIVDFADDDIITLSSGAANADWAEDDNGEELF